jgi:hypothetical protein
MEVDDRSLLPEEGGGGGNSISSSSEAFSLPLFGIAVGFKGSGNDPDRDREDF